MTSPSTGNTGFVGSIVLICETFGVAKRTPIRSFFLSHEPRTRSNLGKSKRGKLIERRGLWWLGEGRTEDIRGERGCRLDMGDYKRPGRPKRQSKTSAAGAGWECSVCTFRNNQGAYTCAVCDARKGTATRKPRPSSVLAAQQAVERVGCPRRRKERRDQEARDVEMVTQEGKPQRPQLKDVDWSHGQQLAVTVGKVTVIITDLQDWPLQHSSTEAAVTGSNAKKPGLDGCAVGDRTGSHGTESEVNRLGVGKTKPDWERVALGKEKDHGMVASTACAMALETK